MRLAAIIAKYLDPGATIIDMTAPAADLSRHFAGAKNRGLRYLHSRTVVTAEFPLPKVAIVLQHLPTAAVPDGGNARVFMNVGGAASRVINIVFFDRANAFEDSGLLSSATTSGWEIDETFISDHPVFGYAIALRRARLDVDAAVPESRLGAANDSRFARLLLRARELESFREIEDLKRQLAQSRTVLEGEGPAARDTTLHERVTVLEQQLALTRKALATARTSLSFRVGRATKLAFKKSRSNPLGTPGEWLRAFRERSDAPPGLSSPERNFGAATGSHADAAIEAQARILGAPRLPGDGPIVAGIASARLTAELSASTRFRSLTPNAWRYILEAERPSYVLVTSDGLAAHTPWGRYGVFGGRNWEDEVAALTEYCRHSKLPTVFWDTSGVVRPRLGIPRGVRFDATFSVSPTVCKAMATEGSVEPKWLAAGVEPQVYNPIGCGTNRPDHALYAGAFDAGADGTELEALLAILRAAVPYGLEVLDPNWNDPVAAAGSRRFPDDLTASCRTRPPARPEARAIRAAGILLCGRGAAHADFVGWQILRGIALGAHVLTTPTVATDHALDEYVASAGNSAQAKAALEEMMSQKRLSAAWQRGFGHLLASYALRDRLDEIAHTCGADVVAAAKPTLCVVAHLGSDPDVSRLLELLGSQERSTPEVLVFADDPLAVEAKLTPHLEPTRLTVRKTSSRAGSLALSSVGSTYLLHWDRSAPSPPQAIAELERMSQISAAEILAVATGDMGYEFGPVPDDALVAVRRDAVQTQFAGAAAPLRESMRALVGEGAQVLTARRSRK